MNDKVLPKIKTKKIAFGCYRRTRAEQDYASYAIEQEMLQKQKREEQLESMKKKLLSWRREIRRHFTDMPMGS